MLILDVDTDNMHLYIKLPDEANQYADILLDSKNHLEIFNTKSVLLDSSNT